MIVVEGDREATREWALIVEAAVDALESRSEQTSSMQASGHLLVRFLSDEHQNCARLPPVYGSYT
jgi:hypothetical protein